MVRFTVRPSPKREDLEVEASAEVVDRREVTQLERRARAALRHRDTRAASASSQWPIEVTLTNRERMTYRMLLGRQAIRRDMLVDPRRRSASPGSATRSTPAARGRSAKRQRGRAAIG